MSGRHHRGLTKRERRLAARREQERRARLEYVRPRTPEETARELAQLAAMMGSLTLPLVFQPKPDTPEARALELVNAQIAADPARFGVPHRWVSQAELYAMYADPDAPMPVPLLEPVDLYPATLIAVSTPGSREDVIREAFTTPTPQDAAGALERGTEIHRRIAALWPVEGEAQHRDADEGGTGAHHGD